MRAEEFGWKATNVGKGGKRPSLDPFNKAMKGHERNPSAKEFASQGLEEYHHYSEYYDTRDEQEDKKKDSSNSNQSDKTKSSNATSHSSGLIRNIVSRVVVAAVGAVVVVNEYQAIQEHEAQKAMPTVASVSWNWSTDNQNATVNLFDGDNTLIQELTTTVYSSQEDPTCTAEGRITYIATAEYEGKTYTDTHVETLPALTHDLDYDEDHIVEQKIEDGKLITVYECPRCHERFTITISLEESD